MKSIFVIILIAGCTYFYFTKFKEPDVLTRYAQLLVKAEKNEPVSAEEIRLIASEMAVNGCNNKKLMQKMGQSKNSCLNRYDTYKEKCERRLFKSPSRTYTDRKKVHALSLKYLECVGAKS